jgi:hypothetical protein
MFVWYNPSGRKDKGRKVLRGGELLYPKIAHPGKPGAAKPRD